MNTYIDNHQEALYKTLSDLLKINTVYTDVDAPEHPYGKNNTEALTYLLSLAEAEGFKTKNIDNQVGYIEYGDKEDYIGVLTHLDVVPQGNDWTHEPFGGDITEDRIIGRGALDDKGPAVASFYALKAVKDSGVSLSKNIRLIFGLNEETGSKCVKHYLTKENPPLAGFTPDADFPVIFAEKGITTFTIKKTFKDFDDDGGHVLKSFKGGHASNMVPDYAEAYIQETSDISDLVRAFNIDFEANVEIDRSGDFTKLSVKGVSAHGSTPQVGRNAVSLLMSCLDVLDFRIGDATDFIRGYGQLIGMDYHGERIGMGLSDETSGKLTLNVGICEMDENEGYAIVNVRYPVSLSMDEVYNEVFKDNMNFFGYDYEIDAHVDPIVHDKDGDLIKTLMTVYRKHTGDESSEPICIGGGTYARSMPNIVAYGPLFKHTHDTMHQADEYMTKSDLLAMTKIYAEAMAELAK